ncbi:MAG TPA: response regulator transcription factor [Gaiellaceae bacterium]|nr:response regulator transcription factor [Gaiellaceae bacterium]
MVDDRSLVRLGLRCLLRSADTRLVVDEAASPGELAAVLRDHSPDVVLLDAELDGRPLEEGVRIIRSEAPGARAIVLGLEPSLDEVKQAFAAGADGYVAKEGALDELVSAIDEVVAGGRYLDPRLGAEFLANEITRTPGHRLSTDEREVLELVVGGLTNRQIAGRLRRPLRTVEGIRARGQRKLGTNCRAELVERARGRGL